MLELAVGAQLAILLWALAPPGVRPLPRVFSSAPMGAGHSKQTTTLVKLVVKLLPLIMLTALVHGSQVGVEYDLGLGLTRGLTDLIQRQHEPAPAVSRSTGPAQGASEAEGGATTVSADDGANASTTDTATDDAQAEAPATSSGGGWWSTAVVVGSMDGDATVTDIDGADELLEDGLGWSWGDRTGAQHPSCASNADPRALAGAAALCAAVLAPILTVWLGAALYRPRARLKAGTTSPSRTMALGTLLVAVAAMVVAATAVDESTPHVLPGVTTVLLVTAVVLKVSEYVVQTVGTPSHYCLLLPRSAPVVLPQNFPHLLHPVSSLALSFQLSHTHTADPITTLVACRLRTSRTTGSFDGVASGQSVASVTCTRSRSSVPPSSLSRWCCASRGHKVKGVTATAC